MESLVCGIIQRSYLDHDRARFSIALPTSRLAGSLNVLKLKQIGMRDVPMECVEYGTILQPCLDHVGAIFILILVLAN